MQSRSGLEQNCRSHTAPPSVTCPSKQPRSLLQNSLEHRRRSAGSPFLLTWTPNLNVGYGSQAALHPDITPTAASEGKPAVHEADFQTSNLNDCFTQQRPFRAEENHDNDRPLSARSGRSERQVQRIVRLHRVARRQYLTILIVHRLLSEREQLLCPPHQ